MPPEELERLFALAASMPSGLNATIGEVILSGLVAHPIPTALALESQALLVDYEMQEASVNYTYRPIFPAIPQLSWIRLLDASTQAETRQQRIRLLSAVALFAIPELQAKALNELRTIECESILHFAHAFSGVTSSGSLMALGRELVKRSLVQIPPGRFIYGNTVEEQGKELRRAYQASGNSIDMSYWLKGELGQQNIFTDGYLISRHPVTNSMFQRFRPTHTFPDFLAEHPVVAVDYDMALDYARWCICDLPTEVEWEKAMRGPDGRSYAWGNEPDFSRCNVLQSGIGSTTPVCYFENHSPHGCLDGNGNVWEWTASDFEKNSWRKTIRGGSWVCTVEFARCATRCWNAPTDRSVAVGFRVVDRNSNKQHHQAMQ